ncbi:MAG: NAD-dependent dehydratase, partial [Candidatus Omnitrophica bacterium CG_4_10_14_0_2_um_filter_44_9]
MKTALITGGAGFIGSYLCDLFLQKGFRVICVDNLITGSEKNIASHARDKNFRFIKHNITVPLRVEESVNMVLHFASPASPVDYLNFPIQTLKVGSLGTHNALGLAKAKGARFLLASTSEVYGDPLIHPQREDYWGNVNPIGPRGVYDEAKRFAEAIVMAYHRVHKLDTKIVRIFNTYGPRMRVMDGRAIPNFIAQALRGEPLTIYGDGTQTRSFCFVSDMAAGLYKFINSSFHGPVNLGNPIELTLQELAVMIKKMTGSSSKIVYKPLPKDDPKKRQPDITQAREKLKWRPKVELKVG